MLIGEARCWRIRAWKDLLCNGVLLSYAAGAPPLNQNIDMALILLSFS